MGEGAADFERENPRGAVPWGQGRLRAHCAALPGIWPSRAAAGRRGGAGRERPRTELADQAEMRAAVPALPEVGVRSRLPTRPFLRVGFDDGPESARGLRRVGRICRPTAPPSGPPRSRPCRPKASGRPLRDAGPAGTGHAWSLARVTGHCRPRRHHTRPTARPVTARVGSRTTTDSIATNRCPETPRIPGSGLPPPAGRGQARCVPTGPNAPAASVPPPTATMRIRGPKLPPPAGQCPKTNTSCQLI